VTDVIAPSEADQRDESESIGPPATTSSTPQQTGRTRISAAWVGVMVGALVLVLLLVFILQNTRSVKVSYFTLAGSMPLGIALLLATIAGLLLAGGIASLRIWQLRHRLTRQTKSSRHGAVAATPNFKD
jgi:putative membrane protein